MGSRFRTELTSIPPVRIKIGRQGIATTVGWKSGSIESGVGDGLALREIGDPRLSGPLPTDRFLIPGTRKDFGGGNVSDMTSPGLNSFKELLVATQRREREIEAEIAKAKWQLRFAWTAKALGWMSLVSVAVKPIRKRASKALALRRSEVAMLDGNLNATKISVNFDMDSEVAEPHRRMQAAFDQMAAAQGRWSVQTERVKARSWAGTIVSRAPAMLRRLAASLVDTQHLPLAMDVLRNRSTAYFYPGFVLIDGGPGADFALIDITELGVAFAPTNFTESESVPRDAQIIGTTWAKANKNGSRDRRFAHNRELPILHYGCLHLSSSGGMNEAFMFSDAEACARFAAAADDLKCILARGRSDRRLENRLLLER